MNQGNRLQSEVSNLQKTEVNGYKRSRSKSPQKDDPRAARRDVKRVVSPAEKLSNQKESKIQYDLAETEEPVKASPLRVPETVSPEKKKVSHSRSSSSSSSRSGSDRSRSRSYSSDSSSASSKERKPAKKVEVCIFDIHVKYFFLNKMKVQMFKVIFILFCLNFKKFEGDT